MKMKTKDVTREELQAEYGANALIVGDGFYLQIHGCEDITFQLSIPHMSLPIEKDGRIVDLARGFRTIPQVLVVLGIDEDDVGVLFCNKFEIHKNANRHLCNLAICDPEEATHVLLSMQCLNVECCEGESVADQHYHGFLNDYTCTRSNEYEDIDIIVYSLIELGARGVSKVPIEFETARQEIIQLANQCLGVESEPEEMLDQSLSKSKSKLCDIGIPGFTRGAESIRFWCYEDAISMTEGWVIDECGRLIAPDKIEDILKTPDGHPNFGTDTVMAEYRSWENLPGDSVLAISWSKPSINENHEFYINLEPIAVTTAQYERVAMLKTQIQKQYADRISPSSGNSSPSVGNGWGDFWDQ